MIELPSKRPETRKFNRAQAIAGAVVVTSLGFRARIICFNRVEASVGEQGIVALVKRNNHSDHEDVFLFNRYGIEDGNRGALGDLCMAQVIQVEGKSIFHGDTVFNLNGDPVVIYAEDFPPIGKGDAKQFRLNPPPVQFEGLPLHNTDKIWYRKGTQSPWELVDCSDKWSDVAGLTESHFGYIKRNEGRAMPLTCYTRISPHSKMLEGVELKVGDLLWYTHPTSKGASIVVHEKTIESILNGAIKHSVFTRVKPAKIEVWQGRMSGYGYPAGVSTFFGDTYPSEAECNEKAPKTVPLGGNFEKSEKVSEYWA